MAAKPPSFLIINVSRIGDTLLVTPAIRAVARAFPGAAITFLGHPKRCEVVRHLPYVSTVREITKNRAWLYGWLGPRYDFALVYGHDLPLLRYALRAAERVVAFRQKDAAINRRLFRAVEPPAFQSLHSARVPLLLTQALDIAPDGHGLAYEVTAEERAWAKSFLQGQLPPGKGPLLGLQVASFPTKAYRDWPVPHFAALCERILSAHPQAHFLLLGGKEEAAKIRELERQLNNHATVVAGKLSLRQTAALMQQLDLYVGVDTGPTHLAGAVGVPMVALYHCYSPGRLLAPLERDNLQVVEHPALDAGGTLQSDMADISVERVWNAVETLLKNG
ncbi:MAG: glycosyltransferase family 9 protein [Burkholderiales bacterium]|nr:glycosyltransferase family 9 protein [Burkholderiales bacterium]